VGLLDLGVATGAGLWRHFGIGTASGLAWQAGR